MKNSRSRSQDLDRHQLRQEAGLLDTVISALRGGDVAAALVAIDAIDAIDAVGPSVPLQRRHTVAAIRCVTR